MEWGYLRPGLGVASRSHPQSSVLRLLLPVPERPLGYVELLGDLDLGCATLDHVEGGNLSGVTPLLVPPLGFLSCSYHGQITNDTIIKIGVIFILFFGSSPAPWLPADL